jgi:hypothetical protein
MIPSSTSELIFIEMRPCSPRAASPAMSSVKRDRRSVGAVTSLRNSGVRENPVRKLNRLATSSVVSGSAVK